MLDTELYISNGIKNFLDENDKIKAGKLLGDHKGKYRFISIINGEIQIIETSSIETEVNFYTISQLENELSQLNWQRFGNTNSNRSRNAFFSFPKIGETVEGIFDYLDSEKQKKSTSVFHSPKNIKSTLVMEIFTQNSKTLIDFDSHEYSPIEDYRDEHFFFHSTEFKKYEN